MKVWVGVGRGMGALEVRDPADRTRDPSQTDFDEADQVAVSSGGIAPTLAEKSDGIGVGYGFTHLLEKPHELEPRLGDPQAGISELFSRISSAHRILHGTPSVRTNEIVVGSELVNSGVRLSLIAADPRFDLRPPSPTLGLDS